MLRRSQRHQSKLGEKDEAEGAPSQPSQHHRHSHDEYMMDDDAPPVLQPEAAPAFEEVVVTDDPDGEYMVGDEGTYAALGDNYYVENGVLYQKTVAHSAPTAAAAAPMSSRHLPPAEVRGVPTLSAADAGFVEGATNVCCGLCGTIVPYDQLMAVHLPNEHPEVLNDGIVDLEEIPYEVWLNERTQQQQRQPTSSSHRGAGAADRKPSGREIAVAGIAGIEPHHSHHHHHLAPHHQYGRPVRSTRTLRRISQIRVNINEMEIPELENALRKKMVEKMGRQVPVSLVDKQHAKCGHCNAVISLNKKFEVVHLIRHFNAWHPSAHKCAGSWLEKEHTGAEGVAKPLSTQDFAVIDSSVDATDNLQCIWCGMFMDGTALAMHFHEIHPEEIEVPKCNLCLQELVVNARLTEKFGGEHFSVTMPDEHHYRCGRFNTMQKTQSALDRVIEKRLRKEGDETKAHDAGDEGEVDDDDGDEMAGAEVGCDVFSNSRMNFGRRSKPKRQFIMPGLRQAVPENSKFVEAVTECHWKCKICTGDIYAAVISAGAIKHYRINHPELQEEMQYELCKARLERVGGGCMEFLDPSPVPFSVIECLLCHMTFPLHRPFNMCRAIRHLKAKHPEIMPEYQELSKMERPNEVVGASATVGAPASSSSAVAGRKRPAAMGKQVRAGAAGRKGRMSAKDSSDMSDTDGEELKVLKREPLGPPAEGMGTRTRRAAAAAAAAVIAATADDELHGAPDAAGGQDDEGAAVYAQEITDAATLRMLREQYNAAFDKAHSIYGGGMRQRIYVLVNKGEEIDAETVEQIVRQVGPSATTVAVEGGASTAPIVVQYSKDDEEGGVAGTASPPRASTSTAALKASPSKGRAVGPSGRRAAAIATHHEKRL